MTISDIYICCPDVVPTPDITIFQTLSDMNHEKNGTTYHDIDSVPGDTYFRATVLYFRVTDGNIHVVIREDD